MFRRDEGSRHGRLAAVFILALLVRVEEALGGEAGEATDVARASLLPPIVLRAVRDAAIKLASPACQEVFSDFHDANGRTLRQNLSGLGLTGEGYLRWVLFYDGDGEKNCGSRDILAATSPGARAVFVCTAQFTAIAGRERGLAAALIIHEELHSLGLRERPPSSQFITAQVIARCGK